MRPRLPAWAILLVLVGILVQGSWASHLNLLYYSRYAPFFDSMSYTNQLAGVLSASQRGGLYAGWQAALTHSTVFLPWMITATIAPLLPYSRLIGVWMQEFWMALLGVSVFIYWRRYRHAPLGLALLWTMPPISFAAVYRPNGGVSDFRMDLSLYILFSLTVIWYLATRETRSRTPWILSAVFLGLTCMSRATSPAYFAVTLGPLLAARFWLEPGDRVWLVRRVASFWVPATIIGLLPVAYNWAYISYYYFTWNSDQNANLPLRQSAIHILLAGNNMGVALAVAAAVLFAVQIANRPGTATWRDVDWALAWIGWAPTLLLVLRGAGPNPFVSMPTVFGALLFLLAPFRRHILQGRAVTFASLLVLSACGYVAYAGYSDHVGRPEDDRASMATLKEGIALMRSESERLGLRRAEFLTAHLADFQATALRNVLIYEMGAVPSGGDLRLPDGFTLAANQESTFSAAVPVTWAEVPGSTEDEKYRHLVALAGERVGFFFLPDEATIGRMERNKPYNYINLKMRRLRRELLETGAWRKTGPLLRITNQETVELYVNQRIASLK